MGIHQLCLLPNKQKTTKDTKIMDNAKFQLCQLPQIFFHVSIFSPFSLSFLFFFFLSATAKKFLLVPM